VHIEAIDVMEKTKVLIVLMLLIFHHILFALPDYAIGWHAWGWQSEHQILDHWWIFIFVYIHILQGLPFCCCYCLIWGYGQVQFPTVLGSVRSNFLLFLGVLTLCIFLTGAPILPQLLRATLYK
jgi:hypothetical protein